MPPRSNPQTSAAAPGRAYEAKNLLVLEGLEAVRKRPAMYIGSTDTRGLMHCLWEIIDNAVDEALAGFGEQIEITLAADGSISVTDQGRGIPVDVEPRTGLVGVEVVYTKLHAGGKFGTGNYNATGGLHGVGASVVNALSSRLDVEVDRNGATWAMSFRRGVPGVFDGEGPDAPFTPQHGLRKIAKVGRGVTGTRVRYWPDRQIFLKDAQLSLDHLLDRARQTSFLVPDSNWASPTPEGEPGRALPQRRYLRVRRFLSDAAVTDTLRSRERASSDGPGARRAADDRDRRRAQPRDRHRDALGHWLRHRRALVREHCGHPEGRHPHPGL